MFFRSLRFLSISIHPPPARWDPSGNSPSGHCQDFNPPTSCEVGLGEVGCICQCCYFNPPTSCEVGPGEVGELCDHYKFQSTHLLRGGTECPPARCRGSAISIHPPPARWDHISPCLRNGDIISIHPPPARWDMLTQIGSSASSIDFNPPTSCEVGLIRETLNGIYTISIHPPPARWDVRGDQPEPERGQISIHPPPARWD